MSDMQPLVDVRWLVEHPEARVADVRWTPTGPPPRQRYLEGHIPGAAFFDLDQDLARPGGPGRHPFPSPEDFAQTLGRLGIGPDTHVVAYDDGSGAIAARLWFMLRAHGHARASVLDGGLKAWRDAGMPVETGEPRIEPVPPPALVLDRSRLADRSQVEHRGGTVLLDARAPERYRGEVEPIDARAGHIPGALNMPYAQNLGPDGRFKPPAALRALYDKLGPDVIVSCGSGVTACHDILALELAGLPPARLYVGSWSDWSSDPSRPIATGPESG
jgi:thiosulfate/3-mercaptopyruvate sulfurtransferase